MKTKHKRAPKGERERNPLVLAMMQATHASPMKDRRDKRSKDRKKSWKNEEW